MTDDLTNLVSENYPRIATDLLTPILELLRLAREHCGGDVDKFLLILVVAIRTTRHPEFWSYTPQELISGEVPVFPGYGTNSRSMAESLNIPKETVRRKVSELVEEGWLVRNGPRLFFAAKAYQELAPVREQIERLAVLNYLAVGRLLRQAGATTTKG